MIALAPAVPPASTPVAPTVAPSTSQGLGRHTHISTDSNTWRAEVGGQWVDDFYDPKMTNPQLLLGTGQA